MLTRAAIVRLCRVLLVASAVLALALAGVALVGGTTDAAGSAPASLQFLRREVVLLLAAPIVTLAALRAEGAAATLLRFAVLALGLAVLLRGVRLSGAGASGLAIGAVTVGAVLVLACLGLELASRER